MVKQRHIKICWNMHVIDNTDKYNKYDYWEGNILQNENGYFEGILKSGRKNEKNVKNFVFGILNDDVNYIYKIDDTKSVSHIYKFKDNKFICITFFDELKESRYGTYKLEYNNDLIDDEDKLLDEIGNFKLNLGNDDLDFYNDNSDKIKKYVYC